VRAQRERDWRGTRIGPPHGLMDAVDVFTGRAAHGSKLDPEKLFATLPIAVLAPGDGDGDGEA
jgi:hypothetical protein